MFALSYAEDTGLNDYLDDEQKPPILNRRLDMLNSERHQTPQCTSNCGKSEPESKL